VTAIDPGSALSKVRKRKFDDSSNSKHEEPNPPRQRKRTKQAVHPDRSQDGPSVVVESAKDNIKQEAEGSTNAINGRIYRAFRLAKEYSGAVFRRFRALNNLGSTTSQVGNITPTIKAPIPPRGGQPQGRIRSRRPRVRQPMTLSRGLTRAFTSTINSTNYSGSVAHDVDTRQK
jgi:hypothetical protein